MINELQIIEFARQMSPKVWYTGEELCELWKVDINKRRNVVPHLKKRRMISTTGKTSQIRYKLRPEVEWLVKRTNMETRYAVAPPPTGNGVIDAKLRKEAKLPETASPLEALITAASAVGATNEKLQNKLTRIKAILEEA